MKRFLFGFILISSFITIVYGTYRFLNTPTYHIRFNSTGGSKVENILIKENNTLKNLPTPTKENYEFVGWYFENNPFDLTLKINQDYTLNAVWKEESKKTYTIYFDTLGGITINPIILEIIILLEPIVVKNIVKVRPLK